MSEEINGDLRLSLADRARYLLRNATRNLASLGRGPRTRPYRRASQSGIDLHGQSPGRYLTEAFLATELAKLYPPTRPVEVVEIGCGSGSLAARLERMGYAGRYTGLDVRNVFVDSSGPLARTFVQGDAHAFEAQRPIDLLLSVSALEHVPRDKELVRRFSSKMAPGGIQVHFVPTRTALVPYLWHGLRQYSPQSISERFGEDVQIVRLGGLATTLAHVVLITPELFVKRFVRAAAPRFYRSAVRGALALDRALPVGPIVYVIIKRH